MDTCRLHYRERITPLTIKYRDMLEWLMYLRNHHQSIYATIRSCTKKQLETETALLQVKPLIWNTRLILLFARLRSIVSRRIERNFEIFGKKFQSIVIDFSLDRVKLEVRVEGCREIVNLKLSYSKGKISIKIMYWSESSCRILALKFALLDGVDNFSCKKKKDRWSSVTFFSRSS